MATATDASIRLGGMSLSGIGFLFPGQGAQTVGMGQAVYEQMPQYRAWFDRARDILGYDLAEVCFSGPSEKLDSTVYSQPALFVSSLAATEILKQQHPQALEQVQAAAGLSLGEYSAIVFAGGLNFEDGLRVVKRRGEAMQAAADANPSGMVSILGWEAEQVQAICDQVRQPGEVLLIANYLCPGNIVVSGSRDACARVAQAAEAAGAMKTIRLAVAGAFHSPLMETAVSQLAEVLQQVEIRPPRVPVYSNVDAQTHQDPDEIRQLLIRQVCSPVLWQRSMEQMLAAGIQEYYEVGPGRVLRGLLKRISRKTPGHGTIDP